MPQHLTDRVKSSLEERKKRGLLRQLRLPQETACDFSSNDYLGLSRNADYHTFVANYFQTHPPSKNIGSTGSRLLSGHSHEIEALEAVAASFHGSEHALLFNSGYDANLSMLSCFPGPCDAVVYDELIHASVHDGMRLSRARSDLYAFRHNDLSSLQSVIEHAVSQVSGAVIVCVETVYSMEGDVTAVSQLLDICFQLQISLQREIHVIADEAHAGGVYGKHGEGLIAHTSSHTHPCLLANLVTFGKAFAAHGAIVLSRRVARDYLVNYARPFIYSTALPSHSVALLRAAYVFAKTPRAQDIRDRLWMLVEHFVKEAISRLPPCALPPRIARSPIQSIRIRGNENCIFVATKIRSRGFDVYPIRSPTVPLGTERIRIILHAHNTTGEIDRLFTAIKQSLDDLKPRPRL